MKTLINILFLFFIIAYSSYTHANDMSQIISWQNPGDSIFSLAKNQNKNILIFVKSNECQWCKKMENEVLTSTLIKNEINSSYIPVILDIEKNPDLAIYYKISSLPTFIFLNDKKNILDVETGYIEQNKFIQTLQKYSPHPELTIKESFIVDKVNNYDFEQLKKQQLQSFQNNGWQGLINNEMLDTSTIEYAIEIAVRGNKIAENWAKKTLNLYLNFSDPVWGGVYVSIDPSNLQQSNFAKSMIMQAQALRIYTQAYAFWKDSSYLIGAEKLINYINRFLLSPEGAFYAGQSAYMLNGEQDPYYYELNNAERLKKGVPSIDKTIYPFENGLAISSYTLMYMITGEKTYLDTAIKAEKWIEQHLLLPSGGLKHSLNENQKFYLRDSLAIALANINLYKTTLDARYLETSKKIFYFINNEFQNPIYGYYSVKDNNTVELDPIANSFLIRIGMLLYYYTDDATFKQMAAHAMTYLTNINDKNKYVGAILMAYSRISHPPIKITVIGPKNNEIANDLYINALRFPSLYMKASRVESSKLFPDYHKPVAFVCANNHCSLPVFDPHDLYRVTQQLVYDPNMFQDNKKLPTVIKPSKVDAQQSQSLHAKQYFNSHFLIAIFGFWLSGLLLAFTPCVLPLVLILTVLIAGQSETVSRGKLFKLSLAYIISLATTYALLGLVAATLGIYLQIYFQNKWVIGIASLIFVILGFSLLDFYSIKLPTKWRHSLVRLNNLRTCNSYTGVIMMGAIMTLLAAPCAAAPLMGAVSYIAQSGNILYGMLTLFAMGLGIGTPLLLVSILGKQLSIPLEWQYRVKILYGFTFIIIGTWFISRLLSTYWAMIAWSTVCIFGATYLGVFKRSMKTGIKKLIHTLSILLLIYGLALFIGALMGSNNFLKPLQTVSINKNNPSFQKVNTLAQIQQIINQSKISHEPVMLDVYAKWCISCNEIDNHVLTNSRVLQLLSYYNFIQLDLTDISSNEREILAYYKIIAPPAILLLYGEKQLNLNIDIIKNPNKLANELELFLKKQLND